MNTAFKPLSWALLWSVTAGIAAAQESPPAVPALPSVSTPGVPAGAPAKAAPKSTAQMDAGEPRASTSPTPTAGSGNSRNPPRAAAASRTPGTAGQKPAAADRLELGTATVTGDREQPKVMYIVPWKRSDIGDQSGKPMNSLLDEALAPVDRDEFKREVAYYDAVRSNAPQNGASNPTAKQGEK